MVSIKSTVITGATGLIGTVLCKTLEGQKIVRALRKPVIDQRPDDQVVGNIDGNTDWEFALRDTQCVIHLAARTHVLDEKGVDSLAAYRQINVDGTRNLAEQAVKAGVKRFVFLSSIKVNGETSQGHAFTEADAPAPEDAYGKTKRDAEDLLREIARHSDMEVVILRPSLVYGPGVKGNFLRLLDLVNSGVPLPLASVRNHRSLTHVSNLVDAIVSCMDASAAAGQTFVVSDEGALSTPELCRKLAAGMNVPARLFPFPVVLLELGARLLGQSGAASKLTGTLVVDASKLRNTLGWRPRIPLDQGLIETARWYHRTRFQRRI